MAVDDIDKERCNKQRSRYEPGSTNRDLLINREPWNDDI